MKKNHQPKERRLQNFIVKSVTTIFIALSATSCSQAPTDSSRSENIVEEQKVGSSTPIADSVTQKPTTPQKQNNSSEVALMKFVVTVDYIIGAARQTANERGSKYISAKDLQSGVRDYGITEDPDIWSIVETSNEFGVGAPVFGLGVCGVAIDPNWKERPGAEMLLSRTECTGTKTKTPSVSPAPTK